MSLYFWLLCGIKNISPWHNILNKAQNKNLIFREKQFCVKTKSSMLHEK